MPDLIEEDPIPPELDEIAAAESVEDIDVVEEPDGEVLDDEDLEETDIGEGETPA